MAVSDTKTLGRIMVVDDQAGIRLLLNEILKGEGYVPFLAANGGQALKLIQEEDIVLVLLDMRIPGMAGTEILKKIKELKPDIKVMIMTAYEDNEMMRDAMQNGAIACFSKPFDIAELVTAIKKEVV
ncbi:response regulator [Sporolactobacillus shoreae]|uniref:Response regulator n=1 Tax=Sporolactobacillus shoreae TaxID=1465501 RepID=A0A4Z0GRC8_9BACL|nr:response regulator [Sporolactobacillus shoreae]TGA99735.1 response regulator [Sporolactobacillus shoreae]